MISFSKGHGFVEKFISINPTYSINFINSKPNNQYIILYNLTYVST